MIVKYFAAVIAVVLVCGYLLPVVWKLKDVALGVVILAGISMMLTDLWQSLKVRDE